jgi:hypothetical protein
MKKVDLTTWGGTKVRNNLKPVWEQPVQDDAEFGQYQSALVQDITNGNELIDEVRDIKATLGALSRRPF